MVQPFQGTILQLSLGYNTAGVFHCLRYKFVFTFSKYMISLIRKKGISKNFKAELFLHWSPIKSSTILPKNPERGVVIVWFS